MYLCLWFGVIAMAVSAEGIEIIAFGDSITAGQGSASGGYPPKLGALFAHGCGWAEIVNSGLGGEQTPQGLGRLDAVLASNPADLILIMEGTNDVNSGISVETTFFNLRAMIDKCKAAGVVPVLATLTPSDRGGSATLIPQVWNLMIRALAVSKEVMLADQYAAIMPTWWTSTVDGLHPNDIGYQTIADAWYRVIAADGLRRVIAVLQILAGGTPAGEGYWLVDIDGDHKIGLPEGVCQIRSAADLR